MEQLQEPESAKVPAWGETGKQAWTKKDTYNGAFNLFCQKVTEPGVPSDPKTVDSLQDLQQDQGTYISSHDKDRL